MSTAVVILLISCTTTFGLGVSPASAGASQSIDQFVQAWNGKFPNYDGVYGSQCVDLFDYYNRDVVGAPAQSFGNANTNYDAAPSAYYDKHPAGSGYSPVRGDVAVWHSPGGGGPGHVAIVLSVVDGSTINVLQANASGLNDGPPDTPSDVNRTPVNIANHSTSNLTGYLHPKSLGGAVGESSFVSYQGNVYRIAGGAPVYVSSWDVFGGPQPATALSDQQWQALRTYPSDGTFVASAQTGWVYKMAGGAPLYVNSWDAVGGSGPVVVVDQTTINNSGGSVEPWLHLRKYPWDGQFISGGGAVYRTVGGYPFWISSCDPPELNGCGGLTAFDAANLGNASAGEPWGHLRASPPDGAFLRVADGDRAGNILRAVGGSFLHLSDCAPAGIDGCPGFVNVANWGFATYLQTHPHPAVGSQVTTTSGRKFGWLSSGLCKALPPAAAGGVVVNDWSVRDCDTKAPTVKMTNPASPGSLGAALIAWQGLDDRSGVSFYQLRTRSAGLVGAFDGYRYPSAWSRLSRSSVSATGLARGHTYCYSVRAIDRVGFVGGWSDDRCASVAIDDRPLNAVGRWLRTGNTKSWNRTITATSTAGASLRTGTVTVARIGIVATSAPGQGSVTVLVGGKVIGTVNLSAATTTFQKTFWLPRFTTRTGVVELRSAASRRGVQIDGVVIGR